MASLPEGVRYFPDHLDRVGQENLVDHIRSAVAEAPLFTPEMPKTGRPLTVRMTNCGALGWVTDRDRGYRYQARHPKTNRPWPAIPPALLELWQSLAGYPKPPEACLINFYSDTASMGLHQDRDETDLLAPVVSISLGNACRFRIGGLHRKDPTSSLRLSSGDVIILGGPGRLSFHGVDRVYPNTSTLLRNGGRVNLTLRRVTS